MIDLFGAGSMERSDNTNNLIPGVLIGIVTNNKDPEKLGRVKVKLPIRDDNYETGWARVATFMAGNEFGALFIPEVNDEVLVAFHRGEIHEPYVIGSLWSKKIKALAKDEKNEIRKIVTKQKHTIEFSDKSSDGKITLKTADGHLMEIADKNDTITIKDKAGSNKLTLKGGSSGEIELKTGGTSIKITSTGDVKITSSKAVTISSTQIKLDAKGTMDIKAGASLNISTNGVLNIKGTLIKLN